MALAGAAGCGRSGFAAPSATKIDNSVFPCGDVVDTLMSMLCLVHF